MKDEVMISHASELASLDEQIKSLQVRADDLKEILKTSLPNGTHVLGCCVLTIKDGSNSHIDKEAMCSFFHVSVDALEPFTKRSTFRTLSAKRATIKE
jgi:hypothetical protein